MKPEEEYRSTFRRIRFQPGPCDIVPPYLGIATSCPTQGTRKHSSLEKSSQNLISTWLAAVSLYGYSFEARKYTGVMGNSIFLVASITS